MFFVLTSHCLASTKDNPLKAKEKKANKEFADLIPEDKKIGFDQFYKIYMEVVKGKRKAYLIDVRTHPEFNAFHIEGTDHISSGRIHIIPKKIKDPDAEIYIFCLKSKRAKYAAGFLYKYGYRNIWLYNEGVIGWARAGLPFVNKYAGKFIIKEYRKYPSDIEESFRIR